MFSLLPKGMFFFLIISFLGFSPIIHCEESANSNDNKTSSNCPEVLTFNSRTALPTQGHFQLEKSTDLLYNPDTDLYLAKVLVNEKPAIMIVDTGATHTILDKAWVTKNFPTAKLGESQQKDSTFKFFWIDSFVLDPHCFVNFIGLVSDLSYIKSSFNKQQVDGIIGMNVLGINPFTLDLKNKKLTFYKNENLRDSKIIPLNAQLFKNGLLTITVTVNDKSFLMMLDSGSTKHHMCETIWEKDPHKTLYGHTTNIHSTQIQEQHLTLGVPKKIILNEQGISDSIQPLLFKEGVYPYGLFGSPGFQKYIFYIDYPRAFVGVIPYPQASSETNP